MSNTHYWRKNKVTVKVVCQYHTFDAQEKSKRLQYIQSLLVAGLFHGDWIECILSIDSFTLSQVCYYIRLIGNDMSFWCSIGQLFQLGSYGNRTKEIHLWSLGLDQFSLVLFFQPMDSSYNFLLSLRLKFSWSVRQKKYWINLSTRK